MKYTFGQFCIDAARRELQHAGKTVSVRPQVFDLLQLLVQSRGKALAKEDLIEQLWPGRKVSDGVLSACIREARKALGDSGSNQDLIKTLHGYGVRFLAEVCTQPTPSADAGLLAPDNTQFEATDATHPASARQSSVVEMDERRVVTYLCCRTLASSGSLSDDQEAKHVRDKKLYSTIHQVVQRFEGYVASWKGHEITSVFGLDRTQEDHALRAVLAAHEINDFADEPLCAGIDTGTVLAGLIEDTHTWHITPIDAVEQEAWDLLGDRAAKTIWLSEPAWQQVQGQVEVEQHEDCDRPMYRICSIKSHLQRPLLRRERLSTRTRLVGRKREMDTLVALAEQTTLGQGQLVGLVGDAGIGKTRLLQELQTHLQSKSVPWIGAFCRSYGVNSPFGLVRDFLRTLCGLDVDEARATAIPKVMSVCEQCGLDKTGAKAVRYLLDLSQAEDPPWDPQQYRQSMFSAFQRLVVGSVGSDSGYRVVAIEDLHFIDSSSEECLRALAHCVAGTPMLLLLTYRTGYQLPFMGRSQATQLALPPLGEIPSAKLVADMMGPQAIEADQRRAIIKLAQGNPFFLQEFALQAIESGWHADDLQNVSLPTGIQAVIRSRIDPLPKRAKKVLQLASVIGKSFALPLIENLVESSSHDLLADLNRLQQEEFLVETSWHPPAYAFRHALTQVATYESLLAEDRHNWHRDIVVQLQQLYPQISQQHPEELAIHYQQCEDWQQATRLWTQSATLALERFAGPEALTHLQHALDCIQAQGPNHGTDEQELTIQTLRLKALQLSQGFATCEVEQAQQRVSELTDRLDCNPNELPEIFMRITRGEFQTAENMARALVQTAKQKNHSVVHTAALELLGLALSYMGRFTEGNQILKRAIELYDKSDYNPHATHDLCVSCYCLLALNYGGMGFGDQSRTCANKAIQLATELQHLPSLAIANHLSSCALANLGLCDLAARQSQEAIAIAEQTQLIFWLFCARLVNGWARFRLGEEQAGLDQVEQAFDDWSDTNARIALPVFHAVLAELYLKTGQFDRATEHIRAGLGVTNQDNQRLHEPELLRLQAKALLAKGAEVEEVDRKLVQAQASAGELQAKLFELRAVADRVRLWQGTAREQEMVQTLGHVLDWFTEGLDLPDLIQAKRLLQPIH